MKKARHKKHFPDEISSQGFQWLKKVSPTTLDLPTVTEAYCLTFSSPPTFSEKQNLENFIYSFFGVPSVSKHQAICCWRETGMILIVF